MKLMSRNRFILLFVGLCCAWSVWALHVVPVGEPDKDYTFIDNDGEVNYDQLYAQVVYELREAKAPYWFNNVEVARIQELNQNFMGQTDIAAIVKACFRKPEEGEKPQVMNSAQIIAVIQHEFPTVKATHSTEVHLGLALKELEYEHSDRGHVAYYKVIPLKADAA